MKAKDWEAVRKKASEIVDKNAVASAYNSAAWDLQEKNEELSMAAELSKFATEFTSAERSKPPGKKPRYLTAKQWNKDRESTYAMYADTYAMVLYKLNDFKNGFPFASEAAKVINKGEDASLNNTYALLTNKYSFHVLMDDENSVIGEYKVDGIPTKFVIDKSGKIRFKSIGFGGDE